MSYPLAGIVSTIQASQNVLSTWSVENVPPSSIDTQAAQNVPPTWRVAKKKCPTLYLALYPGFSKCPISLEGSKCPTL
jgi:hypothetical protein